MLSFIKGIGTTELLIFGIILLFLVGAKKMKELSHGLGTSAKELKKLKHEIKDEPKKQKGGETS